MNLDDVFALPAVRADAHEITQRRTIRQKIVRLEEAMRPLDGALFDGDGIDHAHRFTEGLYAREVLVPKGMLLVGKIHKHEHINIISKGDVSVLTEFGSERLAAPVTFISAPWTKRVVYAHEDTVWTVIHRTDETDLEKIEEAVIAKNYDELVKLEDMQLLALEDKGE